MFSTEELIAALQSTLDDAPVESKTPYSEVNPAMIRHWCEAMHNNNPVYMDEEFAKESEFGGLIAPPEMSMTWSMGSWWPPVEAERHPFRKAIDLTDENGYPELIGTNTSLEFFESLHPGDIVRSMVKLDAVSPEKKTGLGTGFFVTGGYYFYNQKDELVCHQAFTVFKFKHPEKG